MPVLPFGAKLLITSQAAAALVVAGLAMGQWAPADIPTFVVLLGLCVATSLFKVVLPGGNGNLSMGYVFLMWGMARMSLAETLVMGVAATLAQMYWRSLRKPAPIQLVFNVAVIIVSAGAGSAAFHLAAARIGGQFLPILIAAATYFLVNTLTVSGVIALSSGSGVVEVWKKSYFWSFPHYLLGACLVRGVEYFRDIAELELGLMLVPAAYLVYRTYVMHVGGLQQAVERAEQEKRHMEETASLHLRTIRALALAIEAKDKTTGEHLHRVQTYAVELGKDFGLSAREMEALEAAAILHDVGKLAVPEYIISKPGKLTPEEFAKMKIHTVVGAEIVESVRFPFEVAPLVRAHHEKWDGSGYPDGLKGEEIPMGARILTAVDCLDALASDRQYRKAMPFDKAMSIVVSESGKSFDPKVVEVLQRRCHELEALAKATLAQNLIKLSIDSVVERGLAPDAGYATGSSAADRVLRMTPEEASRELAVLDGIHTLIGRQESFTADLLAVEQPLGELIPFDCMALFRRTGERLRCEFVKGECAELLEGIEIDAGVGVSGWVEANRTPLLNGNAVTEFGVSGAVRPGFTLSSGLSVPLESEFGPVGVLTLYHKRRDAFTTAHMRILLAISARLAYQLRLDTAGVKRLSPDGTQLDLLSQAILAHEDRSRPVRAA